MAFTRKGLKGMGLTDEQIESVMEQHVEVVDAIKAENTELRAQVSNLSDVAKERDALKKAAEESGNDTFKIKYETVKSEFEKYKGDIEKAKTRTAKEAAYKTLLAEIGLNAEVIDKVIKFADMETITLDENGKIANAENHKENAKAEWGCFIETPGKAGAPVPPGGGTGAGKSDDELSDEEYYKKLDAAKKSKGE